MNKIVRLSDLEMKPKMDKLNKKLSSNKKFARKFLQSIGIINKHGNLTKEYGG